MWQIPVETYDPALQGLWYSNKPDYVTSEGSIREIEQEHNTTFLLEWPIRVDGALRMCLLFWDNTNWIAFRIRPYNLHPFEWIQIPVTLEPIPAIISKDNQAVFSKDRHDFRTTKDNSYAVDGGPGFERVIGNDLQNLRTTILLPQNGQLHAIDESAAALMRDENATRR